MARRILVVEDCPEVMQGLAHLFSQWGLNEEMEEIMRHFGVVSEAHRGDIRQIAEAHAVLRRELQSQGEEVRDEFKQTRSLMKLSFTQLDQRIRSFESDVSSIKSHVDRLESNQT